jgi:hypothetical protein
MGASATLYSVNGVDRADVYIGFEFDGYSAYNNISYELPNVTFQFVPAPVFQAVRGALVFDPQTNDTLTITGTTMRRGCRLVDYSATIGAGLCASVELSDTSFVCRPPREKPGRNPNDTLCSGTLLNAKVNIGYYQSNYACIDYRSPGPGTANDSSYNELILLALLGIPVVVLAIIITVVVAVWCRKKIGAKRYTGEVQMNALH